MNIIYYIAIAPCLLLYANALLSMENDTKEREHNRIIVCIGSKELKVPITLLQHCRTVHHLVSDQSTSEKEKIPLPIKKKYWLKSIGPTLELLEEKKYDQMELRLELNAKEYEASSKKLLFYLRTLDQSRILGIPELHNAAIRALSKVTTQDRSCFTKDISLLKQLSDLDHREQQDLIKNLLHPILPITRSITTSQCYVIIFHQKKNRSLCGFADGTIQMYDAGKLTTLFDQNHGGHIKATNAVAMHPNQTVWASASDDATIRIWHTGLNRVQSVLDHVDNGHTAAVRNIRFHPNGKRLISTSSDGTIKLWDTTSWHVITTLTASDDHVPCSITALAIHPDGSMFVTGSANGIMRTWDPYMPKLTKKIDTFEKQTDHPYRIDKKAIMTIEFNPNGTTFICGFDNGNIQTWDTRNIEHSKTIKQQDGGHNSTVWALTFDPNGKRFFSGSDDGTIKSWDATSFKLLYTIDTGMYGDKSSIYSLACNTTGTRLVSGSLDKTMTTWDIAQTPQQKTPLTALLVYSAKQHYLTKKEPMRIKDPWLLELFNTLDTTEKEANRYLFDF
jgi:WD40 repeat protein